MNAKLQKVIDEIEKVKRKLSYCQSRLRTLERQKIELENADIVSVVRDMGIPGEELQELIRRIKEEQNNNAPDLPATNAENAVIQEELTIEEQN